jgi:hypothetical protein
MVAHFAADTTQRVALTAIARAHSNGAQSPAEYGLDGGAGQYGGAGVQSSGEYGDDKSIHASKKKSIRASPLF